MKPVSDEIREIAEKYGLGIHVTHHGRADLGITRREEFVVEERAMKALTELAAKVREQTIEECAKELCQHCANSKCSNAMIAPAQLIDGRWQHGVTWTETSGRWMADCAASAIRSLARKEKS